MSNWQDRFNARPTESLSREISSITELKGMHADLIISDFPITKWNRVILADRKQRLKRKHND